MAVATETYPLPQRAESRGISALIVGAGVAGLYAALEFWRQGIDVQIIERASSRLTTGDGFSISYHIIRSFRNWPYMVKTNKEIASHPHLAWHNIKGERLTEPRPVGIQSNDKEDQERTEDDVSKDIYRHSRPAFHLMLETQLEMVGIKVQYGKRVVRYIDESPEGNGKKASVELDSGEVLEADVIVAADGIGSHSTKVTLGYEVPAQSTGFAVYRAAFPIEDAFLDLEIKERFQMLPNGEPVAELWIGDEVNVMIARSKTQMTWVMNHKVSREAAESWSKSVAPQQVIDDVTSKIEGWPEYADRLILMTPKDKLIDFELVWRDPQPIWTSPSGRIVQIGDAAHTFLPSGGNGANQGLEDALSLAKCLNIAGKGHVAEATKVHNKLRFERVSCLQKLAICNQATQYGQKGSDGKTRINLAPVPKYMQALTASWVWKHDPEQYAAEKYHEALAALKDGTPFQSTNIPPGHVYKPWTFEDLLKVVEAGGEIELDGDWWN